MRPSLELDYMGTVCTLRGIVHLYNRQAVSDNSQDYLRRTEFFLAPRPRETLKPLVNGSLIRVKSSRICGSART